MRQVLDSGDPYTSRNPSFILNPIFLSRGDSVRGGGDGNFDNGRSEPVVVRFRGLVRTGAAFVSSWIPVVWWEGTRSWGGIRGRRPSRYRLRLAVLPHWDQPPNPTWIGIAVILELYLDHRYFNNSLQVWSWDG